MKCKQCERRDITPNEINNRMCEYHLEFLNLIVSECSIFDRNHYQQCVALFLQLKTKYLNGIKMIESKK